MMSGIFPHKKTFFLSKPFAFSAIRTKLWVAASLRCRSRGVIAKRLGSGLQNRLDRFDSDSRLHFFASSTVYAITHIAFTQEISGNWKIFYLKYSRSRKRQACLMSHRILLLNPSIFALLMCRKVRQGRLCPSVVFAEQKNARRAKESCTEPRRPRHMAGQAVLITRNRPGRLQNPRSGCTLYETGMNRGPGPRNLPMRTDRLRRKSGSA